MAERNAKIIAGPGGEIDFPPGLGDRRAGFSPNNQIGATTSTRFNVVFQHCLASITSKQQISTLETSWKGDSSCFHRDQTWATYKFLSFSPVLCTWCQFQVVTNTHGRFKDRAMFSESCRVLFGSHNVFQPRVMSPQMLSHDQHVGNWPALIGTIAHVVEPMTE